MGHSEKMLYYRHYKTSVFVCVSMCFRKVELMEKAEPRILQKKKQFLSSACLHISFYSWTMKILICTVENFGKYSCNEFCKKSKVSCKMSIHKIKHLARIYFLFGMCLDVSLMFQNYSSQILLLSVNERGIEYY